MKLYKVVLNDGRSESVPADTYQLVDEQYIFFANGLPIPDVFFFEAYVVGIKVEEQNYEPPHVKWDRFVRQNQEPEATYEDDSRGFPGSYWGG
jgi:hypothetical protein